MYRLEPLSHAHAREAFDCGSEPLNLYLKHTARQHSQRGISRTFVLVKEGAPEPKAILGYFTLNICQLKSEVLPERMARKLPREVSGIKLGRLAVSKAVQRTGLGQLLLATAMRKVLDVFESAGGVGLFVDAKDQTAKAYYERFGFVSLSDNPLQMFLPIETVRLGARANS